MQDKSGILGTLNDVPFNSMLEGNEGSYYTCPVPLILMQR